MRMIPPLLNLPPETEDTPWVKGLLKRVEDLIETNGRLLEENRQLKDEIAELKGLKKKPKFKPSGLDEDAGKKDDDKEGNSDNKRAGSQKRSKTKDLEIHHTTKIKPEELIPEGSTFKGYTDFVVQDMKIEAFNTLYRLERWQTPEGKILTGQLPEFLKRKHFGPKLIGYLLYQHHHCHVTQLLLLEQLREYGIDISTGQINELLSENHDAFHKEKDGLLSAGIEEFGSVTVDDTGDRHKGKNGYVTHIGNEYFAWFKSTNSKSRINFLELLRNTYTDYCINEDALKYMQAHKLPRNILEDLRVHSVQVFVNLPAWEDHLKNLGITDERHCQIATEGGLLGSLLQHGFPRDLVIVSDDAGQFNVLLHGLCWVHAERHIHKLIPVTEGHKADVVRVRNEVWSLYADLKTYKTQPSMEQKEALAVQFDAIFTQTTGYGALNTVLRRIYKNKAELLLVLERPDIPLHTNGSEQAIRDRVKKRKISAGTRSDLGRQCRDTFSSLKKTCRKLGITFWDYLMDRLLQKNEIPSLPDILRQKGSSHSFATGY